MWQKRCYMPSLDVDSGDKASRIKGTFSKLIKQNQDSRNIFHNVCFMRQSFHFRYIKLKTFVEAGIDRRRLDVRNIQLLGRYTPVENCKSNRKKCPKKPSSVPINTQSGGFKTPSLKIFRRRKVDFYWFIYLFLVFNAFSGLKIVLK